MHVPSVRVLTRSMKGKLCQIKYGHLIEKRNHFDNKHTYEQLHQNRHPFFNVHVPYKEPTII